MDEINIDFYTGRHTVHYPANCLTMTLAKCGQSEYPSKSIHRFTFLPFNDNVHNRSRPHDDGRNLHDCDHVRNRLHSRRNVRHSHLSDVSSND